MTIRNSVSLIATLWVLSVASSSASADIVIKIVVEHPDGKLLENVEVSAYRGTAHIGDAIQVRNGEYDLDIKTGEPVKIKFYKPNWYLGFITRISARETAKDQKINKVLIPRSEKLSQYEAQELLYSYEMASDLIKAHYQTDEGLRHAVVFSLHDIAKQVQEIENADALNSQLTRLSELYNLGSSTEGLVKDHSSNTIWSVTEEGTIRTFDGDSHRRLKDIGIPSQHDDWPKWRGPKVTGLYTTSSPAYTNCIATTDGPNYTMAEKPLIWSLKPDGPAPLEGLTAKSVKQVPLIFQGWEGKDKETIVCVVSERKINFYNAANGNLLKEMETPTNPLRITVTSDGENLVTLDSSTLTAWNIQTEEKLWSIPYRGNMVSGLITSENNSIVVASGYFSKGSISALNGSTGETLWTSESYRSVSSIRKFGNSPWMGACGVVDGKLWVFDPTTGHELGSFVMPDTDGNWTVEDGSLIYSKDGGKSIEAVEIDKKRFDFEK